MARRDWYCEDVLSGELDVERVYEDDLVLAFRHPQVRYTKCGPVRDACEGG